MPDQVPYTSKVYAALKDNLQGFDKTPDEFNKAMQDPNYASRAYRALKDNLQGFDKSENDFITLVNGGEKKNGKNDGQNILQPSNTGSNPSLPSQASTNSFLNPVPSQQPTTGFLTPITDPNTRQNEAERQYMAQGEQNVQQSRATKDVIDQINKHGLKVPGVYQNMQQAEADTPNIIAKEQAQRAADEKNDYKGDIGLVGYGIKAQNAAYNALGQMGKGLVRMAGQISKGFQPESNYSDVDASVKKITDFIGAHTDNFAPIDKKEDEAMDKRSHGLITMLPDVAAQGVLAGETGGTVYFSKGYEDSYDQVDKAAKSQNIDLSEGQKQLFASIGGLTNLVLMKHNVHSLVGAAGDKASKSLIQDVSNKVIGDMAKNGEDFTLDNAKKAVNVTLNNFEDRVKNFGMKSAKGALYSTADMTGLEASKIASEKLLNTTSGKQLFDESNQAERMQEALKNGAMFGAAGALIKAPLLLDKGSPVRNSVIEGLYKDPSDESLNAIKGSLEDNLRQHGSSLEEIQKATGVVDQIHAIAKSLPKGLDADKSVKIADLITQRKFVEKAIDRIKTDSENLDGAFKDSSDIHQQVYQDKIDSINDKIKSIASDVPVKYFKEEGEFYKQEGDAKPEKITENRYLIEKPDNLLNHKDNVPENPVAEPTTIKEQPNEKSKTDVEEISKETNGEKVNEENDAQKGDVVKSGETQVEPDTIYPVRQKAIDYIANGIIHQETAKGGEPSPRFDLGKDFDVEERNKAVRDITKGNYDTAPAKKMIDRVVEMEEKGSYPIREGKGGKSVVSRGATPEEIQQHLDDAKSYKLAKEQDIERNNQRLHDLAITHEDIQAYHEHRAEQQSGRDNGRPTKVPTRDAQRSEDVKAERKTPDTSSETTQGQPKAGDSLRRLADKIDTGKINKLGGFKASTGFDALWDASLQVVSTSLRGGAKLADAIEEGLKHIRQSDWYKNLTDKKDFEAKYAEHLNNELSDETTVPDKSGLNKADVENNRQVLGLKDLKNPEKLDEDVEYKKAKDKVDSGILNPIEIANKISEEKRVPTVEEFNAMLYHNRRVDNAYDEAQKAFEKAEKDNDGAGKLEAGNTLIALQEAKDILHNAAATVSYQWGFMGRMMQEAVKQDFSLSGLKALFKAKSGGELSAETEALLTQYVKERDAALGKLQDYEAKQTEKAAQAVIDKEKRKAELANRQAKRAVTLDQINKQTEDVFASISKKLRESRKQANMNPIPPNLIPEISKLVSLYVQKGVVKAADIADQIYDRLKDDIEGLSKRDLIDAIAGNGVTKERTLDELQKSKAEIKKQAKLIARLEDIQSGKDKVKGAKKEQELSEEVGKLQDAIKEAIKEGAVPKTELSDAEKLTKFKEHLKQKLADLDQKIKDGDYELPEPKKPLGLDQEAISLKAAVKQAEYNIRQLGNKIDDGKTTAISKFLRTYVKIHRMFILSRIGTLGKLYAAATGRMITTPIEEALGAVNRLIPGLRKIAEQSPRHGSGLNVNAEVKAFTERFKKATLQDSWNVAKTGHGELDFLYNNRPEEQSDITGFPGRLHAMLKNSTKRAEFFRSYEIRMQHALKHGEDINDPVLQRKIGEASYNDAKRSIFMNDNMLTTEYTSFLTGLEKKNGDKGTAVASVFRTLLPIIKIPTNFAGEALSASTGGIGALPKIFKAITKGAESLTPDQADYVMRTIKKGELGLALMTVAYLHPEVFGGFYTGKRKDDDLKAGDVKVGKFNIPHIFLHNPYILAMQASATLRRTMDEYVDKGKKGGGKHAVWEAFKGIAESVPFFDAPNQLSKALGSDNALNSYVGQGVKNQLVPGLVQEAAEQTDTKDGSFATVNPDNAQKRKPDTKNGMLKSIKENVMTGIPGLRQQVDANATPSEEALKTVTGGEGNGKYVLSDKQLDERKKIIADYVKENKDDLTEAAKESATTNKPLQKKIRQAKIVWDGAKVSASRQKGLIQKMVDDFVEKHIQDKAKKYSNDEILDRYEGKLKEQ